MGFYLVFLGKDISKYIEEDVPEKGEVPMDRKN